MIIRFYWFLMPKLSQEQTQQRRARILDAAERCFSRDGFHRTTMQAIIDVHFPGIQKMLVSKAMDIFYEVRDVPGLKKKPSTSELLDWLKLLLHEDMPLDVLQSRDPTKAIPPLHGALLKNEQDIMLFERLAFMARRPTS